MLPRYLRGLSLRIFFASVMLLLADAHGGPALLTENWESYTNHLTPYGGWILDKGVWGSISAAPDSENGKCYSIGPKVLSRIRHPVDFSKCKDIVLQGWLYDSGSETAINRCILGLGDETNVWIRIGVGAMPSLRSYAIVFSDQLQSDRNIIVNSNMRSEKGWHFMRLEIMHDRTVRYHIWNAARTIEKKGEFGWIFDKAKFSYVLIGSGAATPGTVCWDDIKAGSLDELGPAPNRPSRPE